MSSLYNTLINLNLNKLNKTLKNKPHVLVGPRATKGSYGDLALQLQASIDKREEKEKKEFSKKKPTLAAGIRRFNRGGKV